MRRGIMCICSYSAITRISFHVEGAGYPTTAEKKEKADKKQEMRKSHDLIHVMWQSHNLLTGFLSSYS